jgi:hypothetical protein
MRIEGVKSIAIAVEDTNGQRIEASLMVSDLADISRAIYEGKISKGDISWPDHGEQKK